MKPPYAIGSVPSLSGHAIAYRWRSLPRVRRHRASKPQGSSERVLPWQITMDQLIFASLSHTHYWYEVGMLKVLVVRCAVQTVVASCERVEGDRLNRARRIAQSQRTHDGLLAIIDKSHVARTCSIRAFFCAVFGGMGLQMTCCRSLALRLFCIRLFALIEVSRGPSFNLSSICMRPDSYTELANNYLSRLFLFLCSWELALFPECFVPLPYPFFMESTFTFPF